METAVLFPFEMFAVSPDRQSPSIRINVHSRRTAVGRSFKKMMLLSRAEKKKGKRERGRGKTGETIFTRAAKAFSFNAIRTEHSGYMFPCAGSSRELHPLGTLGALKNSFRPEARGP